MDLDFLSNQSFFSSFLRIGLFIGAIFQIACIAFVIFDNDQDDEKDTDSNASSTDRRPRRNKNDKKKRR
uniref:Protein anon-73B1 n=1 Tax=Megaselia scalaris TaxID=36166 RepID=T1GD73_MEGSC